MQKKYLCLLMFLILLPLTAQEAAEDFSEEESVEAFVSEEEFTEDEVSEESDEGKMINKVIFRGNRKAKKRDIEAQIMSREGTILDLSIIEQDYLKLMELNLFEDISVTTEPAINPLTGETNQNAINLVYEFQEKPMISRILFKGNKNIGIGFLLGDISTKNGDQVDKGAIVTDMIALENKYKEKGFNHVKVDYEIFQNDELKEKNLVQLIFQIEEGTETYISEIEFQGNNSFTESTLKSKMKTKERRYLGIQKGIFQENVFYEDIEQLMNFYREQGYFKVDILRPEISYFTVKDDKGVEREAIKIVIKVNEGSRYTFGGLDLNGNKIFTTDDLIFITKLREGQVFNYTKYQIDLYMLNLKYRNAGYIETRIEDIPNIDEENKVVSFKINITESKRSYIESVYFRGNEKTKTYVLERYVYTKVGDILDQSNLELSRTYLMNLGYFNNVTYDIQQGSKPGLLKVIYILEERLTADFKFGLQVAMSEWPPDVSLFAEVAENNFLGREIIMSGKVEIALSKQGGQFKIQDPWFLGAPVSLSSTLQFYHNWDQTILRKLTTDDYLNYSGSKSNPSDDDIRDWYDDKASSTTAKNMNYIGANSKGDNWGGMGIHDLDFLFSTSAAYRFANIYSVGATYSIEPIYTFLPSRFGYESVRDPEYLAKINEINSSTYRDLLVNEFSVKSTFGVSFSINTTRRKINPYDGYKFSASAGYTWGHYDYVSLSSRFTYYLKLLQMDFNNWVFNHVLSINMGASFIFPGFRNLGGQLYGKDTKNRGPIIDDDDMLYVDGFFVGRGWGSSIGTTSGYEGKLSNKYGFARFDGSLEYRVPIQEQFIWLAAFIDIVNLVEGPKRRFVYTDSNGNAITSGDSVIYSTSSDDAWRWWDQTENNKWYNKDMSNWYGMENWYGSIGLGVQLAIPQLPLSFYIVKRFQINYQGGFEWCGNVANSPNLDFVLSMTGIYF